MLDNFALAAFGAHHDDRHAFQAFIALELAEQLEAAPGFGFERPPGLD